MIILLHLDCNIWEYDPKLFDFCFLNSPMLHHIHLCDSPDFDHEPKIMGSIYNGYIWKLIFTYVIKSIV